MDKRNARIIRPKYLPRCPQCGSKNTVGQVATIKKRIDKKGRTYCNCSKAYFCSNCLIEWDDEVVKNHYMHKKDLSGMAVPSRSVKKYF